MTNYTKAKALNGTFLTLDFAAVYYRNRQTVFSETHETVAAVEKRV